MPDFNNIEVNISGQKFHVQSDENEEYIKKIEEMINKKINHFKESNKKFDNYSSLVFTSFLIADKYLKLVDKLEEAEDNKIKLSEIKDMKSQLQKYKDKNVKLEEEKEENLQEIVQKNNDYNNMKNKIKSYKDQLQEKDDELAITKDILEETESRVKELKKELFLLREKRELNE
ncbi:MAG: cell division protein ZapA [Eubacteriales bacterium]